MFPFEAYVIKDLTHDLVLGRDFLQNIVRELILQRTSLNFPTLSKVRKCAVTPSFLFGFQ